MTEGSRQATRTVRLTIEAAVRKAGGAGTVCTAAIAIHELICSSRIDFSA